MAEKLNNFEKFDLRKRSKFSHVLNPETSWWLARCLKPLSHRLVANKYTKLWKTSENLLVSQGLSYIKIPLCYQVPPSPFVGKVKSIGMQFWCLTYIYGSTEQNMSRKSYVRCHLLLMNLKTVNNYRQEMKFVSSYKVTTSQLWSM